MATLRAACQLHIQCARPQAALRLLFETLPVVSAGTAAGVPALVLTVLAGVLTCQVCGSNSDGLCGYDMHAHARSPSR